MNSIGFDNDEYLAEQKQAILERVDRFEGKLYLEFGGKLTWDYHAARVLPGYDPNVKLRMLQDMSDQIEVILCVFSGDIEQGRIRGDFGITYDLATLKSIDDLRAEGINTSAVVFTRYHGETSVDRLRQRLESRDIKTYTLHDIPDYPGDVDLICSADGFGRNPYIETSAPIVVVTGTGPGSGKMATCLSQLYQDTLKGNSAGYAKFETFPIWDLAVDHPVNIAYEAATVDLDDIVMVDPFHLGAYNVSATNYNRDIASFPILRKLLERVSGDGETAIYHSPTDMGVNRVGRGIIDNEVVCEASKQEVIRRYFRHYREFRQGVGSRQIVERSERLMDRLDVCATDRPCVQPARKAAEQAEKRGVGKDGFYCGAALQLPDGSIAKGKNSPLFHSASACVINAVKKLAGIPDTMHLLPENIIQSLTNLKANYLGSDSPSLNVQEVLVALGISATTNPAAKTGVEHLHLLKGSQMHLTHEPGLGDENGLRKLDIDLTTDANPTGKGYFLR